MIITSYLLSGFIAGCESSVSSQPASEPQMQTPRAATSEVDASVSAIRRGKTTLDVSGIQDDSEARCLRLIHECSIPGGCANPVPNIRAVNALIPMGTDRALKVLRKYLELDSGEYPNRMFTVARIAFVSRDKKKCLRPPMIGSFELMIREESLHWDLYPFVLQDGIPFDLSQGLSLSGIPESPAGYLDYLREKGVLRAELLVPANNPLEAADLAIISPAWKDIRFEGNELNHKWFQDDGWVKMCVRKQALGAICAIYRTTDDLRYMYSYTGTYPWDNHLATVRNLKPRWDATVQRYVRDD